MKTSEFETYVAHNLKELQKHGPLAIVNGYDDYQEKSVFKFYSRHGDEILTQIDKVARSCNKNIFEFLHDSMTARAIDITAKKRHADYPNHVFHKVLIIEGIGAKMRELEEKAKAKENKAAGKGRGGASD